MNIILILGLSISFQLAAAVLALRLIRISGRRQAWILISLAVTLMAIRRLLTLWGIVTGHRPAPVDWSAEWVALITSGLLFLGIYLIRPLFRLVKKSEESLRESEKRYRTLFENSREIIVITTPEGKIIDINPYGLEFFGYTRKEMLELNTQELYVDPSQRERFKEEVEEKGFVRDYEVRLRKKDGEERDCLFTFTLWEEPGGSTFGYQGIIRDNTKRKQADDQVRASLLEKETLLKEIHHRVKNNLQIISSLLNLPLRKIQDPQAVEIFKESQNRVKTMAFIHEQLYQSQDLSRIDFAKYVQNLTANLVSSFGFRAGGVQFTVEIEQIFLEINTAIPLALIINELISNCLKYAFPSTEEDPESALFQPEIRVSLQYIKEKEYVLIVRDNGVSFPQGWDIEQSPSLGLRLIRALTVQINGGFEIHSNQGTEFVLRFSC
jgi:PAS domain S-box-containing protein